MSHSDLGARVRAAFAALLGWFATASIAATSVHPQPFDSATWRAMKEARGTPTIVVFTALDCAYCAAEVDRIKKLLSSRERRDVLLVVVATDGLDGAQGLLDSGKYGGVARMYYFATDELRLRYVVDPRWRGETPYIAVLSGSGPARFAVGHVKEADLDAIPRP